MRPKNIGSTPKMTLSFAPEVPIQLIPWYVNHTQTVTRMAYNTLNTRLMYPFFGNIIHLSLEDGGFAMNLRRLFSSISFTNPIPTAVTANRSRVDGIYIPRPQMKK